MKNYVTIFLLIFFVTAHAQSGDTNAADRLRQYVFALTKVMYHDVVNPPAAARFYSYCMLTAYEIQSQLDTSLPSFQKNFRAYPVFNNAVDRNTVHSSFAVLYGLLETGKTILPSGYLLEEDQQQLVAEFKPVMTPSILDSSVAFAKHISKSILQYSRQDGYFKLSTLRRYSLKGKDSTWRPTPPEYMAAVEPNWHTIRTFFLDSARQFPSLPAIPFNSSKGSSFYSLANEVYETGKALNDEQKLIANYWDCNPFAVQYSGHMSVGLKKISPGGHWMSITGIASKQAGLDFTRTIFLYTLVACSLHDAFVVCWEEKFRSNRLRPETAINRFIDEKWKPLLQTPPFPEYTSGHSVISTATGELLTHFLGDKFLFNDTTETYIGLPSRQFTSFRQAADEACISRLYGGIHFRDAIENGREQGRRISGYVIDRLAIRPLKAAR
ncbi:MAG: vanadium-dependent haloperoxidase [Chitinophagaceae bacterium]